MEINNQLAKHHPQLFGLWLSIDNSRRSSDCISRGFYHLANQNTLLESRDVYICKEAGVVNMVRGVLGSLHQGCFIFAPYGGMQCTAMALIALAALFSLEKVPHRSFSSSQIDDILFNGNRL